MRAAVAIGYDGARRAKVKSYRISVCSDRGRSIRRPDLQPAELDGLLPESGVMRSIARPSDDKGAEESIAAAPGGAHELKEIKIQRQLLL